MSREQKLADRLYEVIPHPDFDPERFAFYLTRCGWMIQKVLFAIVKNMILHWTLDYEHGETKGGSDDYLIITMRAKQLQELIDRWD
jgi:hypothetical protein